ncbi:hypothetical protein Mal4_39630 [Maioricimonas rarisocia]|uniref:TIR domain-containing protein n=1 Tax=Maioricimonas rarisocia TaxID=2528026 RepID=A0A517ZAY4_9PLAN|nr:toll/interleukin-1 receptor domain-containing protein [Maioricimonas rarisocia]QDU39617.1 hypothetical protein Mal4_39630 [Maioricimonas rarisocia]
MTDASHSRPIDDVFLSYKSENADVVRSVAESLMANGLRVWFAEYRITSEMFEDDAAIQRAIDSGIDGARYSLVFTNNRWADSPFCEKEIERILERQPREFVAEVQIPPEAMPHEKWPALGSPPVRAMRFSGETADVIDFVSDLGWFPERLTPPDRADALAAGPTRKLRFGIGFSPEPLTEFVGVELTSPRMHTEGIAGEVYVYTGQLEGRDAQLLVTINPFQTVLGQLSVSGRGNANDRRVYNAYRKVSDDWLSEHSQKPVGLHLRFWDGRSHLGVTSILPERQPGRRQWERRYAVTIRQTVTCLRCGSSELVPYYRHDLTSRAWGYTICSNDACNHQQAIPIAEFRPHHLQTCSACGRSSVQPDEQRVLETQASEAEQRFLCVGSGPSGEDSMCGAQMIVPAGRIGDIGEVDLALAVDLPDDGEESRRTFCRLMPQFDAMVSSLTHTPLRSQWDAETARVVFAKAITAAMIWAAFEDARLRYVSPVMPLLLASFGGAALMDLLASLYLREPRNEAVLVGMKWGWRFRIVPFPTYGRRLDRLWNTFVGSVVSFLLCVLFGTMRIGWLAIAAGVWRDKLDLWYWGLAGALTYGIGRSATNFNPQTRRIF